MNSQSNRIWVMALSAFWFAVALFQRWQDLSLAGSLMFNQAPDWEGAARISSITMLVCALIFVGAFASWFYVFLKRRGV